MSRLSIIAFILPITLTIACEEDPCLPTVLEDTSFIPAAENCFTAVDGTSTGSTSGDSSGTSIESTGGSTGDVCPVQSDVVECGGDAPSFGEMWGPCIAGGTCLDGMLCMLSAAGEICAPSCDNCGCPGDSECTGGACLMDGACMPSCVAVGDPCPVAGMICDPQAKSCVWPKP